MKNIFYTAMLILVSSTLNATNKEIEKEKKDPKVDTCSITYIVKEREGNVITTSEYTFKATTCEEVEAAAVAAGIIKAKSISAN